MSAIKTYSLTGIVVKTGERMTREVQARNPKHAIVKFRECFRSGMRLKDISAAMEVPASPRNDFGVRLEREEAANRALDQRVGITTTVSSEVASTPPAGELPMAHKKGAGLMVQNKLTTANILKLSAYISSELESIKAHGLTAAHLADKAGNHLGFKIVERNIRSLCKDMGIDLYERKTNGKLSGGQASEAIVTLASALAGVMRKLGEAVPVEVARLAGEL